MKATVEINTKNGVKKIDKDFKREQDARAWLCSVKSDSYFGYTDDGCFAIVWGFDFSQVDRVAEPLD